jgi:hypothetical protein
VPPPCTSEFAEESVSKISGSAHPSPTVGGSEGSACSRDLLFAWDSSPAILSSGDGAAVTLEVRPRFVAPSPLP